MRSLEDAEDFSGDLLVIGEAGLDGAQAGATLREALRRGYPRCPVLALRQAWGEPAAGTWREVWSCAPRHPLFRELTARDLEGWRGGGVTRGPWLDEPVGQGRCLLHVASGWSDYGRPVLTEETPDKIEALAQELSQKVVGLIEKGSGELLAKVRLSGTQIAELRSKLAGKPLPRAWRNPRG